MSADVHIGKDGWLFLIGGSNNVLAYFVTPDRFSQEHMSRWLRLLENRHQRAAALGARYIHLIAPEKLTVYPEHYDGALPFYDHAPSQSLTRAARRAKLDHLLLDPTPYLKTLKQYPLYFKTDTHWTFHGAFAAYQLLCSRLGFRQNARIPQGKRSSAQIILDLGGKLNPPVRENWTRVEFITHARRVHANAQVLWKDDHPSASRQGLHVGSNVVFRNDHPDAIDQRVVLFGDSFSESAPFKLTGMLAETFREVHFVWSISMDWTYVERVKPDLIISEAAERFMGDVPGDRFDLEAHERQIAASLASSSG